MLFKKTVLPIIFFVFLSCSGENKPTEQPHEPLSSNEEKAEAKSVGENNKEGQNLYLKYCMACHQLDGSGVPGMYPPIVNSPIVNSDKKEDFIKILLYGLKGPIEVHGKKYNQQMPKQDFLSDEDLAKIINYVSTNFENKGHTVTPQEIKPLRLSDTN
ncbi:MAG: cytochrome c [Bacteroidetes bacterium]|nr:cytochrome c [Bacteroidota bacterium]